MSEFNFGYYPIVVLGEFLKTNIGDLSKTFSEIDYRGFNAKFLKCLRAIAEYFIVENTSRMFGIDHREFLQRTK